MKVIIPTGFQLSVTNKRFVVAYIEDERGEREVLDVLVRVPHPVSGWGWKALGGEEFQNFTEFRDFVERTIKSQPNGGWTWK